MFSYVSLAPIAGDLPVVVWVTREKLEDGRYALIYRERPVHTQIRRNLESDYALETYKKGQSLVVMDGLDDLKFRFYGYYYAKQKEEWSDEYEGEKRFRLPTLVEIDYVSQGEKGTLYFGIRANSTRKTAYNETN
jgi:general secretion pathway protein J